MAAETPLQELEKVLDARRIVVQHQQCRCLCKPPRKIKTRKIKVISSF
jgi:hypothetical protein